MMKPIVLMLVVALAANARAENIASNAGYQPELSDVGFLIADAFGLASAPYVGQFYVNADGTQTCTSGAPCTFSSVIVNVGTSTSGNCNNSSTQSQTWTAGTAFSYFTPYSSTKSRSLTGAAVGDKIFSVLGSAGITNSKCISYQFANNLSYLSNLCQGATNMSCAGTSSSNSVCSGGTYSTCPVSFTLAGLYVPNNGSTTISLCPLKFLSGTYSLGT